MIIELGKSHLLPKRLVASGSKWASNSKLSLATKLQAKKKRYVGILHVGSKWFRKPLWHKGKFTCYQKHPYTQELFLYDLSRMRYFPVRIPDFLGSKWFVGLRGKQVDLMVATGFRYRGSKWNYSAKRAKTRGQTSVADSASLLRLRELVSNGSADPITRPLARD